MLKRRAVAAIASAFLAACGEAQYRDVSEDPEQKRLINQTCEVTAELGAHGVTRKLEREKKTDYISIWSPGFTGPELTFLVLLTPGTRLQVLAARECSNCPFDRMLEYSVKVTPEPEQFAGKPAYVQASSMTEPFVRCPVRISAVGASKGAS